MKTNTKNELCQTIWIKNSRGERLEVELSYEGGEMLGVVFIDEIPYHVFYASRKEIGTGEKKFIIDRDPGYVPKMPPSGKCILIAPYAK